jgi:hypothetical protein
MHFYVNFEYYVLNGVLVMISNYSPTPPINLPQMSNNPVNEECKPFRDN